MGTARKTVVIFDADHEHRSGLAGTLRKHNYEVLTPDTSDEIIQNASRGKIDLVLTDHSRPAGIDGIELTRKIKSSRKEVKVIFFSECLDLDMYIREMNSGAEDCLEKPCRHDDILRVIESSFRRKADANGREN